MLHTDPLLQKNKKKTLINQQEKLDERTVFILVRELISNPQVCLFYQAN